MSGGAFNYLCYMEASELLNSKEELTSMVGSLRKYGYPDIAEDAIELIRKIEEVKKIMGAADEYRESLEDVFHAVEWYESADYSKETMLEVLEEYRVKHKEDINDISSN